MRNAFGSPGTVLVLGGNSDIGWAILQRLAARGLESAVLAVRDPNAVAQRLQDAPLPNVDVHIEAWDTLDSGGHALLIEKTQALVGDVDLVLCTVGALAAQSEAALAPEQAEKLMATNYVGPATALLETAKVLRSQRHGSIVVLSSVAGARARAANFLYGSAKAGIDAFAQGLRDSLDGTGVLVHIVRPGFVASQMTEGMDPAPFATDTSAVAKAVEKIICARTSRVIWIPPILGVLFLVFRNLPSFLWRRIAGNQ